MALAVGGAEIWPKKTRFVCSYSVSIGIDLIEEAFILSRKQEKFDSLWSLLPLISQKDMSKMDTNFSKIKVAQSGSYLGRVYPKSC